MRRRLITILTGLSLMLCVATVALWILSDVAPFQWDWTSTKGREDPAWSRGQLCVGLGRVGYVAWMPAPKTGLRYLKARHRFQRKTPNEFSYDHPSRFDPWTTGHLSEPAPVDAKDFWWRGVQYSRFTEYLTHIAMRQLWLPFWLIAACLLMLPLLRMSLWFSKRARASHRMRTGRCSGCGYDLAGNTSCTCPECGMHIQTIPNRTADA